MKFKIKNISDIKIKEDYTKKKIRIFKENHSKLLTLIRDNPKLFDGFEIKKYAELNLILYLYGDKVLTLENNFVYFHKKNKLSDFLKQQKWII